MKLGAHHLVDLAGVDPKSLNDPELLRPLCLEFCQQAGVRVLHVHFHQFQPQGVTGLVLIAESHLSIHTWPEHGSCAIDFFSCRLEHPGESLLSFFRDRLHAKSAQEQVIHREVPGA